HSHPHARSPLRRPVPRRCRLRYWDWCRSRSPPWRRDGSCPRLARRPHRHRSRRRRARAPRRLEVAPGVAEALVVTGPLREVAAEVDETHVERAELLRPLEIEPLPLEHDEILLLVGGDDDARLAIGVIPEGLPRRVEEGPRLAHEG